MHLLLALLLLAPDTVRGRVVDPAGHAVSGVEIVVSELGRVARTGDNGEFAVDAPVKSTLVFRRPGFVSATRKVRSSNQQLDVVLAPSPFQIEPIHVTAQRGDPLAGTAALPTAALSREDLRRESGVSLAHALEKLPGVRTLSTGEQVGKPVIRGMFGSRVLVLEDALRLEDYSWSDEDAPSIDSRFADRVEVVRGPASIMYGSDALGGVVNVIPEPVPQPGSDYGKTGVELSLSSNRTEAGLVAHTSGASNSLGWRALAVGRFAEDFRTPYGKVENTGYGAFNGEVAVGTRNMTLRIAQYGGEYKLLEKEGPTTQPGAAEEEEGPERKLADQRVQLVGNFPLKNVRLETRAQYQRHWLQEVADELTPAGQPKVEAPVFELQLNTITLDAIAHHSLASNMRGSIGASFVTQENDSKGVLPVVPDASIRNAGVAAIERLTTGRIEWMAGARADHHTIDPTATKGLATNAATSSENAFSFDFGAVAHPASELALRANVGRGWRAPNLFELYAAGPRIGEARYEFGDAALKPEQSLEFDVGANVESEQFGFDVSFYDNRIDNFIALQPTTQFIDGLRVYRHDQSTARVSGVELNAEFRPTRALQLEAEYDAVRATNRDTGQPLPWIPAPRLQLNAELGGKAGSFARSYARLTLEHVWKKTRLAANEPSTDAYTLLGVSVGGETRFRGHETQLDLGIKNATNVAYKDFLNRYRDFAYNPGRDITLRVSFQL